jgi:hypothetical protein
MCLGHEKSYHYAVSPHKGYLYPWLGGLPNLQRGPILRYSCFLVTQNMEKTQIHRGFYNISKDTGGLSGYNHLSCSHLE